MREAIINYQANDVPLKGHAYFPEHSALSYPAVIVAHAWRGQDNFARNKAKELAKLGYIGFAADLYGEGKTAITDEEAGALMYPLASNRLALQQRIGAAFDALKQIPEIDQSKIGGIGFCFGGITIIELLRSGKPVKGVVSFHAGLNAIPTSQVQATPITAGIQGSLLILTGYEDPLATQAEINLLEKELNEAQVDWQLTTYGHATHSFTNPEANTPERGFMYNAKADQRSWLAMKNFFNEIFNS